MITYHDSEIVQAIKTIITSNESAIVAGIVHQGQPRQLSIVTTSKLTPPTDFYYVSIDVPNMSVLYEDNFTWIEYDVGIRVGDYAITQPGEDELYEDIHSGFRLVCNRIVEQITSSRFITSGNMKFLVGDSPDVQKIGQTGLTPIDGAIHVMIASLIKITVRERCL